MSKQIRVHLPYVCFNMVGSLKVILKNKELTAKQICRIWMTEIMSVL